MSKANKPQSPSGSAHTAVRLNEMAKGHRGRRSEPTPLTLPGMAAPAPTASQREKVSRTPHLNGHGSSGTLGRRAAGSVALPAMKSSSKKSSTSNVASRSASGKSARSASGKTKAKRTAPAKAAKTRPEATTGRSAKIAKKVSSSPRTDTRVRRKAATKQLKKSAGAAAKLGLDNERLLDAYRTMLRARKVDEKAIVLYKQNKCHFQIGCAGHEAVQVAAALNLEPGSDYSYPYYRDMAFSLAWGITVRELFLNALNKAEDPCSGGRQMPMHYGHPDLAMPSQSSPTGTQFLQAVGAAKALTFRGTDRVVYVSAGEGTCAQGAYHEALNWAAREKLPVIFLIEDNLYAISVHISEQLAGQSVAKISSGYEGCDVVEIDGLDFFESYEALARAVARARRGDGPTVISAQVVRLQSHSISDNQAKYRSSEDIDADKVRDPIVRFGRELVKRGIVTAAELDAIAKETQSEIDREAEWAEAQRDPAPETAERHVYADPDPSILFEESKPSAGAEELFLVDALNAALDEELARNPEMVVYGQDVAHGKGGVFTVTAGLTAKYGVRRVFNSPLAEASIVGTAVGMATLGMKPVAEIQFGDYVWTAMMDIRNELALMSYRSDGGWRCPAVLRIPVGGYIHGAVYHSQNIEATFAHFPGLYVVLPSNAWDAKGLLKAAIRGNDPVLFLEHKGLYRQVYAKGPKGGPNDLIPLGKARIAREGKDATIVTWGALVNRSLVAAETLRKTDGVEIEVIDLRTILPYDRDAVLASVRKTGRLLIAHEDVTFMGFGAEVAAEVADSAFEYLDAPIRRVGGRFTPIPHSPILERTVLPQTEWVEAELRGLLAY